MRHSTKTWAVPVYFAGSGLYAPPPPPLLSLCGSSAGGVGGFSVSSGITASEEPLNQLFFLVHESGSLAGASRAMGV